MAEDKKIIIKDRYQIKDLIKKELTGDIYLEGKGTALYYPIIFWHINCSKHYYVKTKKKLRS